MNVLELRDKLRWSVGVDIKPLAVNQANLLARTLGVSKRFFYYSFDLNKEPGALLRTLLPEGVADVVFMFSVNAYLTDFPSLLKLLRPIASLHFIELNDPQDSQAGIEKAHASLLKHYRTVRELTNYTVCSDCRLNKGRLFACSTE